MKLKKKLYRSSTNKKIGGVCGGIAEYFNIDASIVRLLFLFFWIVPTFGSMLFIYIVLSVVLPYDYEVNGKQFFDEKDSLQQNFSSRRDVTPDEEWGDF